MRAGSVEHSTPAVAASRPGDTSMERAVDALGERAADSRHARQVVHARRLQAAQAAEVREQRLALARADAGDVLERRRGARLRPPGAMTLDGEAVRFVADLLKQMQSGIVRRKIQRSF